MIFGVMSFKKLWLVCIELIGTCDVRICANLVKSLDKQYFDSRERNL